jgi:small subunit ribosomal protein S2
MATKKLEEKKALTTAKKEVVKKTVKKEVVSKETVKKTAPKKEAVKKTPVKIKKVVKVEAPVVAEEVKEAPKGGYKSEVTVEQLFEAGAHFGHVVKKWNPKMKQYLWGEMNGIHIFALEKTVSELGRACEALQKATATGKKIVIVGTKRQARQMVEEMAKRVGIPYMTQRWLGGLITNWRQVKQTIDRLNSLRLKREQGQLKKFTKKEQVLFDKEISRLERIVGGLANLKDVPEMIIVIDTHKERLVVKEASSRGVSIVGLVDSNANPDKIDYPIPMNDDATKGLEIVVGEMEKALMAGQKELKN